MQACRARAGGRGWAFGAADVVVVVVVVVVVIVVIVVAGVVVVVVVDWIVLFFIRKSILYSKQGMYAGGVAGRSVR